MFSFEQRQIVLGTLLGNGFICSPKSPYLCIQHSIKAEDYLLMKAKSLEGLERKSPVYRRHNIIGWRSSSGELWNEFYHLCYDKKKHVSMQWLDQLHPIGLAVWFCDSGTFTGNQKQNALLRTSGFQEDNLTIEKYFQEVGIPCKRNKIRDSYNIVFSIEGTHRLFDLIGQFIPECVARKWQI